MQTHVVAQAGAPVYCEWEERMEGFGGLSEPIVEPKVEGPAMPGVRRGRSRAGARLWLRRIFLGLVVLGAIPAVLTFLYALPFVHPISTLMWKDLITFNGYDRRWVALDDIAPVATRSVIMSEDGQFCYHRGVDWVELNAVIEDAFNGERIRGASTITMQTVKNLYLWHRPLGSVRKAMEVPLAVYFDAVLSKKRIIEIYLNIAEWGPNVYGIEAAAQYHFGKSAKSLTARQAALLAVTLPNPIDRDPAHPGPGLKRLASIVQKRAANGAIHVRCLQ
jgi:monofunctional biosynthetic peptidoglycan transglycosylase